MSDLFISYSRRDRDFVRRLHDALAEEQRDIWVDWEDIPPVAEWLKEISAAIEAAQAFVFVISPDSVASDVCGQELAHAVAHNKRLIPIVCREVDARAVPEALARLNWVFFRGGDDFETSLKALTAAIETDLEWVKEHTRLLTRAIEWEARGHDKSLLLRGSDLKEAEEWLGRSGQKEPRPTSLQTGYIIKARQASTKRQRIQLGSVMVGLGVSIVLSILAVRQAQIATSRELAAAALHQLDKDPELGLLLAMEAVDKRSTRQAEEALRQALFESHVRVTMHGHQSPVVGATYSHDGTRVASVGEDGSVKVRDAATGAMVLDAQPLKDSISGIVFTPGDRHLVVVDGNGLLRVWDAANGKLSDAARKVVSTPFAFQGKTAVAVQGAGAITVEDAVTGQVMKTLRAGSEVQNIAAVSPDGAYFATTGDLGQPEALLIDSRTGKPAARLLGGDDPVWRVSFSPDGKEAVTVARWAQTESGGGPTALGDKSAWVWEVPQGRLARELRGHTRQINSALYSPNGLFIVTAGDDGTARVWDAPSGRELVVLRGHRGPVHIAVFSSDGTRVVTAGADGTVRLWDAATGYETRPPELAGKTLLSAAISPDGALAATTDYDDRTAIWETAGGALRFTLSEPTRGIFGASFSPNGGHVVSLHKDVVKLWSSADGSLRESLSVPSITGWERAVMSRDGRLLALLSGNERTASGEEEPLVIDIETGAKTVLKGDGTPVYSIAFSPDGRRAVTGGEAATLRLWDLGPGTFVELKDGGHTDRVLDARFSPDGKTVITTSRDTSGKLWDVATARKTVDLLGHNDAVVSGFFSPDGTMAATVGADGTTRLWDVATGRQLAMFGGFPGTEPVAAFANGGLSLVAVSQAGFVRRYDLGVAGGVKELLSVARKRVTRKLTAEERGRYLHEK